MLTQSELKECLYYDPITGIFIWRISNGRRAVAGSTAGTLDPIGYIRITINKKRYQSHRLAYLYVTGSFPPNDIDHINNIRDDNRFANLREATRSQNMHNSKMQKNNTSGRKGVCWQKQCKKWRALITINNKKIHLGLFNDIDLAYTAYCNAATKLHRQFANFG